MTLKTTSFALGTILLEELPPFLVEERRNFTERNRVSGNNCCPWCLKAYLVEKAIEKGMEEWAISMINRKFPGKTGHNGYYMDTGGVKKISN